MTQFRNKNIQRILLILLMFVLVNSYGTIGFMLIEGLPFSEAFYLSGETFTTVGFGDLVPHSGLGRAFAVSAAVAGLLFTGISVGLFVQMLYEETLQQFLKGNKMEKSISKLRDHFIVCGVGNTGNQLVSELQERGFNVVVIDANKDLTEDFKFFLLGDARKDSVLQMASVQHAKGLAAVLKDDADNVFITLTARNLNPKLKIVSRFKDPDTEKKLRIAGADFVTSPYKIGGHRLALSLVDPFLINFLDETLSQKKLGVQFGNIVLPEKGPVNGKALRDSGIRENSSGSIIVAVISPDGQAIFNPQPQYVLKPNSMLLVLGTPVQIAELKEYVRMG